MKRVHIIGLVALAITLAVSWSTMVQGGGASAKLSAGYDLFKWTADGGGGSSSEGGYTLDGTIGQPDAGVLSGGNYTLAGGFWQGGGSTEPPAHCIFLPLVLR